LRGTKLRHCAVEHVEVIEEIDSWDDEGHVIDLNGGELEEPDSHHGQRAIR
jgi:hypothetical protein